MKMIVGLGNYGNEYLGIRHNIGFNVLDYLIGSFKWAALYDINRPHTTVSHIYTYKNYLLVKPISGNINSSGIPVSFIKNLFNIDVKDIVVIYDDITLDIGKINIRSNAGHGKSGHNGLSSIIEHIGKDFSRVRVGIGKPDKNISIINYVLGEFKTHEISIMCRACRDAAIASEIICSDGVNAAMNKFNHEVDNVRK